MVAENLQNVNFNEKRRKHVGTLPREDYVWKAVRKLYADLKDANNDDVSLK